jgi:TolB protein
MEDRQISFTPIGFTLIILLLTVLIGFLAWQAGYLDGLFPTSALPTPDPTPSLSTLEPTATLAVLPTPEVTPTPAVIQSADPHPAEIPGLLVLSMWEAGYTHLFAYHPEFLPLTRLTFGEWSDRQPAIHPDGSQIAFSSNRSGQWDLYLLDLTTGETSQLTDDPNYDGNPAWSSDGLWLAYEKYVDGNLDIYQLSPLAQTEEIRLTTHPAADLQPAWQPGSTVIAFTSARTGQMDIFLKDTTSGEPEQNYTLNSTVSQSQPVWAPSGAALGWISAGDGYPDLWLVEIGLPAASAQPLLQTDIARWDPTGSLIAVLRRSPDGDFLAIQSASDLRYLLLPTGMLGSIESFDWGLNLLPDPLPTSLRAAAQAQPEASWLVQLVPSTGALFGRQNIIDLPEINAPHPSLVALAVEPFYALKDRANLELGWDLLSDLENMFVPISEPLPPGKSQDWLYTGRAFSLNPVLIDYGYMQVVREDYGSEVYWRIFVKPLDQSGAQGQPLTVFPWDFNARFSGSAEAYESGGQTYPEIPPGYWIDFTTLAQQYGWERLPALTNWQSYYPGARFNQFAITQGLAWTDAMLQLWPPEVFQSQP